MSHPITRILVPTDFSVASEAALAYAVTLAHRFGASVHLLHVVHDPFAGAGTWGSDIYIASVPAMRDTLVREASAKLTALLARAEERRIPARSEVRVGRPAEVIGEVAREEGADLIVMGTHGRTGIAHLLLGSVAEKTLREAPCPVLTVRSVVEERESFERALATAE